MARQASKVKPGEGLGFLGTQAEFMDTKFPGWKKEAQDNFALIQLSLAKKVNPSARENGSLIAALVRKDRTDVRGKPLQVDLSPLHNRILAQPKDSVPWRRLPNGNYQCEFRTSRFALLAEYDKVGNLRNYQIQGD